MPPWDESLLNSLETKAPDPAEGRILPYAEALREGFTLAMERDPSVIVMGQGVDDPSAMFGASRDLHRKFGGQRVFDTPVSEDAMTGICVGAAMSGLRPVLMHNRPDFILLSFNQLVNHAANYHYMDNGQTRVPMVIWSAIGRGWGTGAQHSHSIQGLLIGVPGLKIVMPSTPADAKGLLLSAIEDNNPVLIFEHRWLMRQKGGVPEGYYKVPIGKGAVRRRGTDVTIAAVSHAVELSLKAAELLEREGISAEVLDLRTVKPIDEALILESLKRTGRLVVADTGWMKGGVCAEVGCVAAEKGFDLLKAPVRRVGLPDIPTPAGYTLEQLIYPDASRIAGVVRELCGKR
jgi:acetoin:2,6-dichlorophenolindophenol oxidoreductase subunit beta